ECVALLGETASAAEADALVARFAAPGAAGAALAALRAQWDATLGAVEVATPSPALDALVNGWLAYQTLSCRIWGRSAFYQSGGAFGFRDQLQDAAALVHHDPQLTRAQILLHAAHQFPEGDVLHWWHPPQDRGTRTRFADDLLWLPYLTAWYVEVTGDRALLDEPAGFVTARALEPGEDEAYLATVPSGETAPVYEHCVRAIERSLAVGPHGLPLMGTGDWNDGMNLVGREGRGESVWMAFFLYDVLRHFEPLAAARGDAERARRWAAHRAALAAAIDAHAWDGAWYRRAWFDDGTPLGTASADECRIDVLPQAWAVLTGAVSPERTLQAMDSAERELVMPEGELVRLLKPPFDRMTPAPGYIQGYVPGIRENGGQYTHAAMWLVRATAQLGRRDRALELLEMLLPVHHADTPEDVATYQVEPYVVAADVYAVPPHVGRGGWTWYTGSSGWMLRVALESILGLTMQDGARLVLRPCVPDAWPGYTLAYRVPGCGSRYVFTVRGTGGANERVVRVALDGAELAPVDGAAVVPIARDGAEHAVAVELGAQ
ncbi:MAG: glycosyl transferase, partial [Proteobacteria bacterium]